MMDLHCHVDLYPDYNRILEDIKSTGFYVLSVTTVPSAFEGTCNLTRNIKHCRTALGLHPQLAHQRINELPLFDKLIPETRYIGEIGLDGSRGYKDHFNDQLFVFNHILKKCESYGNKILTIHSLNAVDEVLNCLGTHPKAGTAILHWFLATKKQVEKAIELGCYFSIGPAMLSSNRAKKVISWLPKNRVLLETDGPFAKLEGNIVYPSNVISVLTYLSDIWNIPYDEVRSVMKLNLVKLLK
ncbi:Qat anti-phage system TatD family nuclease QatD [Marinomonas ostreistagni]|uniref:Qat anti-phage system TatD family nuclease QatD n=1 Tax=Marinomonas ostreistagni TaxID=359209 RepID=UPI0019520160|nr:Qat anti-phage system TatD family nuclease QatD [Marinomonas ostreistagni]MBM6552371.1 TatD family hydrolase [Marinomonas ostreistagni]